MKTKSLLILLFVTKVAFASAWMTGPLLAPSGSTIPAGHVNIETYTFYSSIRGMPTTPRSLNLDPIITIGLAKFIDVQFALPYIYNWNAGQHGSHISDYSVAFGFQVLRQVDNSWMPDLRISIQETFPTGKFDELNIAKHGTDATGSGAYQTALGLNFQKTHHISGDQFLRTRLTFAYAKPSEVKVTGPNVFGGGFGTHGKVKPGGQLTTDLAFEYSLTKNWVPAIDILFVNSKTSRFAGEIGITPSGDVAGVGGPGGQQFSIAPALEYNFCAQLGVIGGMWLAVGGAAPKFRAGVIAVNYYF